MFSMYQLYSCTLYILICPIWKCGVNKAAFDIPGCAVPGQLHYSWWAAGTQQLVVSADVHQKNCGWAVVIGPEVNTKGHDGDKDFIVNPINPSPTPGSLDHVFQLVRLFVLNSSIYNALANKAILYYFPL